VPDVRPYLQHASVVVAPLRVARGIQNKILEAMAMGRPVVASHPCVESLDAQAGRGLLAATTPQEYVERIGELLNRPALAQVLGDAGRAAVLQHYGWSAHLAVIDRHLGVPEPVPAAPEPAHAP
jgi:glycosyltransferase involved in cell wall biosynthesis